MKLEDHKSVGSDSQKDARPMSGRKPAYESRATEFRRRLIAWRQAPESLKPSLRALARELGTNHQILSYHENRLDGWLAKERAKQIRARAEAEGRPMTFREQLKAGTISKMAEWIEELRKAAKRGPLRPDQFKLLKMLVGQGVPGAHELAGKCRQMTPEEERQARTPERKAMFTSRKAMFTSAALNHIERIKQAADQGPLPWRDTEILKILARRKCAGAKELLEKYSKSALPRPQVPH